MKIDSPNALADLERLAREGAEGVRLKDNQRSPGSDPLALWRKAGELGMVASVGGYPDGYYKSEFARIAVELPNLRIVLEHLAGMAAFRFA